VRTLRWGLVLFLLMGFLCVPVAAQGCEDCREIKKELRDAALDKARQAPASSPAAPHVRVVLYWAEGCGHCDEVLDGVLPSLERQYGAQLEVRLIEVVTMEDIAAFFDVAEGYGYARGHAEVPFLLIGERALTGVEQIRAELPELIDELLGAGGSDWPHQQRSATPQPGLPPADASCSFATLCAEETTAGPAPAVAEGGGSGGALPVVAALSLVTIAGGSAAAVLWRRTVRRPADPSIFTDAVMRDSGDKDAT
jgi:thiol-disulfide isomerase/thioredoxin